MPPITYIREAKTEFEKNRRVALRNTEGMLQLRALINSSGDISSYYLKQNQKNVLSMLFQLPTEKVSLGDTWKIPVNFIELGNGFIPDDVERYNKVTLNALYSDPELGTIAEIFYTLGEKISGKFNLFPEKKQSTPPFTIHFSYIAVGEFLVDKGKWKHYAGQLTLTGSGYLNLDTHRLHYLTPQ